MARVNVDQRALTDSRFTELGFHLRGEQVGQGFAAHALGLGVMIHIWNECQERGSHSLSALTLFAISHQLGMGHIKLDNALVVCELGEIKKNGDIRIKGTEGRIEWLEKRREEGKKGGRPRKTIGLDRKRPRNNPLAPALALSLSEETTTTDTVQSKRLNGKRVGPSSLLNSERMKSLLEDFETLYQFYPRHVGRQAALRSFIALDPDLDTLREIARDLKHRSDSGEWVVDDRERVRFIPHLATYLNQRRWTDDE